VDKPSLITQRRQGIDFRRATRRQITRQQRYREQRTRHDRKRADVVCAHLVKQRAQQTRQTKCRQHSDPDARQRQDQSLLQDQSFAFRIPSSKTNMFLNPTVLSTGSSTAYWFDTAYILQSGDVIGAFRNAGTNVLSINSDGGILSGKGISTVDTVYSFRSSHAVNLGEDQRNTLYIDATRNSASYTNYAELNFSAENTTGSSATSANLLIDSNKSGLGASFEVALNTTPISTNNASFVKFAQDFVTHFQANQIGIQTAQPSTGDTTITPNPTNAVWRLGKVITGATVALTTTNYVEVYIDGVVKKLALAQ